MCPPRPAGVVHRAVSANEQTDSAQTAEPRRRPPAANASPAPASAAAGGEGLQTLKSGVQRRGEADLNAEPVVEVAGFVLHDHLAKHEALSGSDGDHLRVDDAAAVEEQRALERPLDLQDGRALGVGDVHDEASHRAAALALEALGLLDGPEDRRQLLRDLVGERLSRLEHRRLHHDLVLVLLLEAGQQLRQPDALAHAQPLHPRQVRELPARHPDDVGRCHHHTRLHHHARLDTQRCVY